MIKVRGEYELAITDRVLYAWQIYIDIHFGFRYHTWRSLPAIENILYDWYDHNDGGIKWGQGWRLVVK